MSTKSFLSVVGIITAAVAISVVLVQLRPDPPRRPPGSSIPFVTTELVSLESGPIPIHGSGTVRPRAEIDVAAQISGKVAWVSPSFQSGGRVRSGELLFRIDDADFLNRVQQARANVAAQQVALLQAEEEARIAQSEYDRFRARESGRAGGTPPASPLTLREPHLAAARAALARDSAGLADAELALARTEVRAAFDGVVRSESVDPGQFVAAGQGVGRFYAADAVEVLVPLADSDADLIPDLWALRAGEPDERVRVTVMSGQAGGRYGWSGYVDRARAALDEQTRTIDVVIRVPDPFAGGVRIAEADAPADAAPGASGGALSVAGGASLDGPPLLVGQFVDVRIEGAVQGEYFVVPRRALRTGNEVWAIKDDSLVTVVPVRVVQRSEELVYLTGALEANQAVVVGGLQVATEGMVVRRDPNAPASPSAAGAGDEGGSGGER